jgi:hypothetical protein
VTGRKLGDMTPDERAAMIQRAAAQMQAELEANADAIGRVMDEAELREIAYVLRHLWGWGPYPLGWVPPTPDQQDQVRARQRKAWAGPREQPASDYASELAAGQKAGAARASDRELLAMVASVAQVALGGVSPKLIFDGAEREGLTGQQLAVLLITDPGRAEALQWTT